MGNPITTLARGALGGFHAAVSFFESEWRALFDTITLQDFEARVEAALFHLAQCLEYSAVLSADFVADAMQHGQTGSIIINQELRFLRWTIVPEYASLAYHQARRDALQFALNAEAYARRLVTREHALMERRVLLEELSRLVEVADVWARLHTEIAIERNNRIGADDQLRAQLTALIARTRQELVTFIDQVRQQLTAQIDQLSKYAHSIPGLVDQAATRGYDPTLTAHATAITRLLDTAAAHEPLIAGVVGKLAGWLVDLAEVEDPILRLAAQFVLRQVIDRLGLDTALGQLLHDLLGPVLGGGPPKTLQQVTAQVGARLNGAESAVAQLAPLAPEADALHEMGTAAFDVALLGYLAAAVATPVTAADDTVRVLTPVTEPLLTPLRSLLGIP